MALPQKNLQNEGCTYADLLSWDDDERFELYEGQPVALASPTNTHQEILTELILQLGGYLRRKRCKIYPAPFDVRLFEKSADHTRNVRTVVQPDLSIVCDPSKVDRRGIHGVPDMVVEILSDSTKQNDRLLKFHLYQKAGVPEYWIVDPDAQTVAVHLFDPGLGIYGSPETYPADAVVPVSILEDCAVDLKQVFAPPFPED